MFERKEKNCGWSQCSEHLSPVLKDRQLSCEANHGNNLLLVSRKFWGSHVILGTNSRGHCLVIHQTGLLRLITNKKWKREISNFSTHKACTKEQAGGETASTHCIQASVKVTANHSNSNTEMDQFPAAGMGLHYVLRICQEVQHHRGLPR